MVTHRTGVPPQAPDDKFKSKSIVIGRLKIRWPLLQQSPGHCPLKNKNSLSNLVSKVALLYHHSSFEPELNTSPAKQFSYSPYSGFRVGAALLTVDGRIIKGACIDNASYCKYQTRVPSEHSDQSSNHGDFLRWDDLCRADSAR